jgi:hypothetical protein
MTLYPFANWFIIQPYSAREALGQYWMKDLENGTYRRETYVAHIGKKIPSKLVSVLISHLRHAYTRRRQRGIIDLFTGAIVLVEETSARLGVALHRCAESDYRGYRHSVHCQSWEGA